MSSYFLRESDILIELFCLKHHMKIELKSSYHKNGLFKYEVMFNQYKKTFYNKEPITLYEVLLYIGEDCLKDKDIHIYSKYLSWDAIYDLKTLADPYRVFCDTLGSHKEKV
jgi:hypothetical protein